MATRWPNASGRAGIALIVALVAMVLAPFLPDAARPAVVVVMLVFSCSAVVFFVLSRPTRSEVPTGYRGSLSPRQRSATLWGVVAAAFVIAKVVNLFNHN